MKITYHPVHPALHEFVETIMCINRTPDQEGEFSRTSLPSHECFLSFEYQTDFHVKKGEADTFVPTHTATIIPPQIYNTVVKGGTMKAIIIKFREGAFFRLFKVPIRLFKNLCYDARDVSYREISNLSERIINADTLVERIAMVEQFLLIKARYAVPITPIDKAFEILLLSKGNFPIQEIASIACMSIRQLQRKFPEHIGLSPKQYSKLVRFTNACRMRTAFPQSTWGDISDRCGYYDQMHLIRDFRSITRVNPGDLSFDEINPDLFLWPNETPLRLF